MLLVMFDSLNIYIGRNVKQFTVISPVKIKKLFVILFWYCRKRAKAVEPEVLAEYFKKRIALLKYIQNHVIIINK